VLLKYHFSLSLNYFIQLDFVILSSSFTENYYKKPLMEIQYFICCKMIGKVSSWYYTSFYDTLCVETISQISATGKEKVLWIMWLGFTSHILYISRVFLFSLSFMSKCWPFSSYFNLILYCYSSVTLNFISSLQ
jgi:hypothetical protein